jgi:hypothetical protein
VLVDFSNVELFVPKLKAVKACRWIIVICSFPQDVFGPSLSIEKKLAIWSNISVWVRNLLLRGHPQHIWVC